VLSCIMAVKWQ